ncbi:MAG: 1-acyl-sn-glycerol-3-phosphate acyltransferase [Gemmataceae bacterium]|nr:1-acyl-sn-glycerol-3-phosphate acyltransferase [Gemmataceae bacterium]MCI0743357.1 1-acyl-sn-glycerol-3-phosphate acyltransferase [Gemmataceae bacterium]
MTAARRFLGLNITLDPRFRVDDRGRLRVKLVDPKAPGLRLLNVLPRLFPRLLGLAAVNRVFGSLAKDARDVSFFQKAVDAFDLDVTWPATALERIPKTGPLLVTANHPRNGMDGLAIAHMVSQVRGDVKVMLTSAFEGIPGMAENGIFVNDSDGPSAGSRSAAVREAIDWLRQGHVVILFPAGEGSYVRTGDRSAPVDAAWRTGTTLLIRKSSAQVLPVFVDGAPGRVFQMARRVFHPAAMFLLIREMMRQKGGNVRLEVGAARSRAEVLAQGDAEVQMSYLRNLTYSLDNASKPSSSRAPAPPCGIPRSSFEMRAG